MKNPVFSVTGTEKSQRNASIIYSGGDDVFVVGSWEDVIGFAVDLNDSLEKFSQGTLTISAGVGMFSKTYPLYAPGAVQPLHQPAAEGLQLRLHHPPDAV